MTLAETEKQYNETHCQCCYKEFAKEELHPVKGGESVCTPCRRGENGDYGYVLDEATGEWYIA